MKHAHEVREGYPGHDATTYPAAKPRNTLGAFLRRIGMDAVLRASFGDLKQGSSVVYPMERQMRLLIDANAVGELGYNPRYPGRPSYHPLLSVVAETQTCIGAQLRAGNAGLGANEAALIQTHVRRVVASVPKDTGVVVRIDSGADCTGILAALDEIAGTIFVVKARLTPELAHAVMLVESSTPNSADPTTTEYRPWGKGGGLSTGPINPR